MIRVGIIVVDTGMKLTSEVFSNNGMIPSEYTCDGTDISPQLSVSDVPKTAKTLALIMDDPDAPMGTFVHWVVWNISPDKSTIAKGEDLKEPQGTTGFGKRGYGGPCPPGGTHRYFFKLYALDTLLDLEPGSPKSALEKVMANHIIEQVELVGKYSRT